MAGIVKQQRILVETPNAKLDGLVFTAPERGGAAAVILHPYALLGGSMSDPVCIELFRAAAQSRAFSLVLRYNQRGVGHSSGRMNVMGKDDMVDVLDVVEFAAAQLPGPDKQVVVIGYSWGSCVAAHALSHPSVVAYVGVSVPLGGLSWVLQTKKHFQEVCRATHVPRLLLLGDSDQFTGLEAMQQAVLAAGGCLLRPDSSYEPHACGAGAGELPGAERQPLQLRVFEMADHFWMSHHAPAAEYVVGWLEALLARRRRGEHPLGEQAPEAEAQTAQQQQQQEQEEAAPEASAAAPEEIAAPASVEAAQPAVLAAAATDASSEAAQGMSPAEAAAEDEAAAEQLAALGLAEGEEEAK